MIKEADVANNDVATKQDIANLKTFIEARFRELVAELGVKVVPRYLDVAGCAAYIGRMDKAVRHLVKQAAIPYAKIGRRVTRALLSVVRPSPSYPRRRTNRVWPQYHRRRGRALAVERPCASSNG